MKVPTQISLGSPQLLLLVDQTTERTASTLHITTIQPQLRFFSASMHWLRHLSFSLRSDLMLEEGEIGLLSVQLPISTGLSMLALSSLVMEPSHYVETITGERTISRTLRILATINLDAS